MAAMVPLQGQDHRLAKIAKEEYRLSERLSNNSHTGEAGASPDAGSVTMYVT